MSSSPPPSSLLAFPERPQDRLRRALRRLDAALADQAAAVAGFRRELGLLSEAVEALGGSLQASAGELQDTQAALASAGAKARQLEATADAMLAGARH